jgi:hypothetical protein
VKESPSLPRLERRDLWLTPLVVQFSDFRWTAAPPLPHEPDRAGRQDKATAGRPAVPPRDDIVGWPDELLIEFPDFPDCTLDSVADTSIGSPIGFSVFQSMGLFSRKGSITTSRTVFQSITSLSDGA